MVLVVQVGADLPKGIYFTRINPLDPGDEMLSQKRLVDASIDTFPVKTG
jgi:hypothetical protein